MPLTIAFDDRPWGVGRVGAKEHFLDGFLVISPFFSVTPVFLIKLPAFTWVILTSAKSV